MTFSLECSRFRQPEVPAELMRYTWANDDFEEFLLSGAENALMFRLALEKYAKKSVGDFERMLDFGCGCGRILRFFSHDDVDIYGCDVNGPVVEYVADNFPSAQVYRSDQLPPLEYEDAMFQLVCSFSVFSHLPLEVELEWLRELVRVGEPGCIYLLTVHGDWFIEATLDPSEQERVQEAGFWWKQVHNSSTGRFPKGYEASYHTSDFIRRVWSEYLEIVAVIKGNIGSAEQYLPPGMEFEPRGDIPRFRAMGQDLVVARRRMP